jgi:hypothetical protein
LNKKAAAYAEIKGEEYKAEDYLKEYQKVTDSILAKFHSKDQTCLNIVWKTELIASFLKA